MVRLCSFSIDCEGSDFPITNYSSEGPETNPLNPCLWFPGTWKDVGGLNLCVSEGGNPTDCFVCSKKPIDPDPTKLCNEEQTCTVECPGGATVSYTVPAGIFCDTDDGLPPELPAGETMPGDTPPATPPPPPPNPDPEPLPEPSPQLRMSDPTLLTQPGSGSTILIFKCYGLDPLMDYIMTWTISIWGSTTPVPISVRFTSKGSTYDFKETLNGDFGYYVGAASPSLTVTYPLPSVNLSKSGVKLIAELTNLYQWKAYTVTCEIEWVIDEFGVTDSEVKSFVVTAPSTSYTYLDDTFFSTHPNATIKSGSITINATP